MIIFLIKIEINKNPDIFENQAKIQNNSKKINNKLYFKKKLDKNQQS